MAACSRWWAKFDADDAFSFTTPRFVRIQDRRLGLPYYGFLGAIVAYIIGVVIVKNEGYLAHADADGVTRLQLLAPSVNLRNSIPNLQYCNQSDDSGNSTFINNYMILPFSKYPCLSEDEIGVVYPPDEVNAMFITTRATATDMLAPSTCNPQTDTSCLFNKGASATAYMTNTELFTLKLDHSLDVPEFNLFVSATNLDSRGLRDINDKEVSNCEVYHHYNKSCPALLPSIYPIGALLWAAGVPGATLDSTLNFSIVGNTSETRRYGGMVMLLDIEYYGTVSLTGGTDNLGFSIRPRFAASQEYKVQQSIEPGTNATAGLVYTLLDRHGIRIIVRQTGSIGRFDFQALLLSLTSSLALLAVAKTVVELIAFQLLPLKFIYRQYRTIDTIDFSDLTAADEAVFRKHDVINPHPKIGLQKIGMAQPLLSHVSDHDSEPGGSSIPVAPVVTGGAVTSSAPAPFESTYEPPQVRRTSVPNVQQRQHVQQDGFWGDLHKTFQQGWDGGDSVDAEQWQG